MREPLPIGRTIAQAYGFVFGQFGGLMRVALVPAVAIVVLIGVLIAAVVVLASAGGDSDGPYIELLTVLMMFVAVIPFLVKWHRVTLFGPDREPPAIGMVFGRREFVFLGYMIGLIVIAGSIAALPLFGLIYTGLVGSDGLLILLGLVLMCATFYVFARLAFVLPATAAGRPTGFGVAWRQCAGNAGRLAVILFLAELPWRIAQNIIEAVVAADDSLVASGFSMVAGIAITLVSMAILASVLSIAYREIVGVSPGDGPPTG